MVKLTYIEGNDYSEGYYNGYRAGYKKATEDLKHGKNNLQD